MSETPRTDRLLESLETHQFHGDAGDVVDFARGLERELASVTAERDQARRERDALLEALAWRPIETAPKDKSSILIIDSENFITIGDFSEERGCFANTEECWKIETPTHWMPLPEPPKGGAE